MFLFEEIRNPKLLIINNWNSFRVTSAQKKRMSCRVCGAPEVLVLIIIVILRVKRSYGAKPANGLSIEKNWLYVTLSMISMVENSHVRLLCTRPLRTKWIRDCEGKLFFHTRSNNECQRIVRKIDTTKHLEPVAMEINFFVHS